jgi:hypothetical protein
LEDHAHPAPYLAHVLVFERQSEDAKAARAPEDAVEVEQQRALARAVRPDDGYRLPLLYGEVDPLQHLGAVRIAEAERGRLDGRRTP